MRLIYITENYKGFHQAPMKAHNAPLHNITQTYPDDIYGPNAARYYGHGDPPLDAESIRIIRWSKDKPDAKIKIYRAVPNKREITTINPGDWVTINPQYAVMHGESALNGNYKILTKIVKASQLYTEGNSIHEFGYDPS